MDAMLDQIIVDCPQALDIVPQLRLGNVVEGFANIAVVDYSSEREMLGEWRVIIFTCAVTSRIVTRKLSGSLCAMPLVGAKGFPTKLATFKVADGVGVNVVKSLCAVMWKADVNKEVALPRVVKSIEHLTEEGSSLMRALNGGACSMSAGASHAAPEGEIPGWLLV